MSRHFGRIGFVRHACRARSTAIPADLASFARFSTRETCLWLGDRPVWI